MGLFSIKCIKCSQDYVISILSIKKKKKTIQYNALGGAATVMVVYSLLFSWGGWHVMRARG